MTKIQLIIKYCALALAALIIVGIIGTAFSVVAFFGLVDNGNIGDMEPRDVNGNFTSLDIDIGGASLDIVEGECFKVESNYDKLRINEGNATLRLSFDDGLFSFGSDNAKIVLTIPFDWSFDEVDIETGAGKVYIEALKTKELSLGIGTGAVDVNELYVYRNAEISGGAGELYISGGKLRNLELDMGIGKTEIESKLIGNCQINQGIGEAFVLLVGSEEDYRISVDKGIGNAYIDGITVESGKVYGDGETCIDVEGGVGTLKVDFTQKRVVAVN